MGGTRTGRVVAAGAAIIVTAGLAGSSVAAAAAPPVPYGPHFAVHTVRVEYEVPNAKWEAAVTNAISQWSHASTLTLVATKSTRVDDGTCVPDQNTIRICIENLPHRFSNVGRANGLELVGVPMSQWARGGTLHITGASWALNTHFTNPPHRRFLACEYFGFMLGMRQRTGAGEPKSCMTIKGAFATPPAVVTNARDTQLLTQFYANP